MSHYNTLNIPTGASADDVKRAYRAASSKAHPDKGGSNEQMAEVNRAYAVLSDAKRREAYDSGAGDGDGPTLPESARAMLLDLFDHCLEESTKDVVTHCHQRIDSAMDEAKRGKRAAEAKAKSLAKRRPTVNKTGDGENILHALIDKKIAEANAKVAQMGHVMALLVEVRVQLKDYSYEPGPDDMPKTAAQTRINDEDLWAALSSAGGPRRDSMFQRFKDRGFV